jgi:hypothetical protein
MRRSRCQHAWKLIGVNYNEPPDGLMSVRNSSEEFAREAMYGVTTLTQRCEKCGWTEVTTQIGRTSDPLARQEREARA